MNNELLGFTLKIYGGYGFIGHIEYQISLDEAEVKRVVPNQDEEVVRVISKEEVEHLMSYIEDIKLENTLRSEMESTIGHYIDTPTYEVDFIFLGYSVTLNCGMLMPDTITGFEDYVNEYLKLTDLGLPML